MKLLFWNVQRLGVKTPDSQKKILEQVIAEAFFMHDAELALPRRRVNLQGSADPNSGGINV